MYILNIYLQEIFVRVVGMKNGDKIYNTGNLFVNRNWLKTFYCKSLCYSRKFLAMVFVMLFVQKFCVIIADLTPKLLVHLLLFSYLLESY